MRIPILKTSAAAIVGALAAACAAPDLDEAGQSVTGPNPYQQTFTAFESGHVRPLALTADRKVLLATNTPDARLEVFRIEPGGLVHEASVPVGLEPVAVATRGNGEAWVVNHLSDSVSVVALRGKHSRVERTLLVGDEPRDIVFAGPNQSRAFITTAHRGQNSPLDPQLATPGVGRADVWVFDAAAPGSSTLGGTPLTILTFFAEMPRALAVSPDPSGGVTPRHLNKHIDYDTCCAPIPESGERPQCRVPARHGDLSELAIIAFAVVR